MIVLHMIGWGKHCWQRSDSTDFYEKCVAAGVTDVELEVWPRMWHCFQQ